MLLGAYDVAFLGRPWYTEADVRDDWARDGIELGRDVSVLCGRDGAVHAYLWCWVRDPGEVVVVAGSVHPEYLGLGLGSALVERAEAWARARAVDARRALDMQIVCVAQDARAAALFVSRGFRLERHFYQMDIELDGTESAGSVPPGIEVRGFSVDPDAHEVHRVLNQAFAGHWRSRAFRFEEWKRIFIDSPGFDQSLWFVALDDEGIVGALMGKAFPTHGWINSLGVLTRARGRGVGKALLRTSFASFAARGLSRASLNVDAGNETGATALYRAVGMHPAVQVEYYEKRVEPG